MLLKFLKYHLVVIFISGVMTVNAKTTLTVKVTVIVAPSCIINDNQIIDVDFGIVLAPMIGEGKYTKVMNYSLECKGHDSNAMRMMILGKSASFDNSLLKTNMPNLGISLVSNGSKLNANEWFKFNYPTKPRLEVKLVKNKNGEIVGGDFQSSATLLVAYQ